MQDTLQPDRIVIGVADARDAAVLREIYSQQITAGTPVIETDFATAELVKVAANSFLATKISFINAMADVCRVTGADVATLAEAIGHDERIGKQFLRAGIGFGGGCLPKDVRAFMARGDELGVGRSWRSCGRSTRSTCAAARPASRSRRPCWATRCWGVGSPCWGSHSNPTAMTCGTLRR